MITPREKTDDLNINLVNGAQWELSQQRPDQFSMLLFYRGKHCPICKHQLETLQDKLGDFTERGINVIAMSTDDESTAKATYKDWNIDDVPLGYGLDIDTARKWGLFISEGLENEPEYFNEPGIFILKPDQTVYWESIQSMPFGRPAFDDILKGIDYITENDYPARGEA